jgi:Protein of unknown function (DUF2877)
MSRASTPTMHLAALSAGGRAARGRFNGTVHSVFRQSCNIRLDDGRMLALLAPHLGNVPHGVRLDAPAGFVFSRHLAVSERVSCRADVLRIAGALSIDLGSARAWQGELSSARVDLAVPDIARAWGAAWHALRRGRACGEHSDAMALTRAVDREGVRLARAARALQAADAANALDRLIGRGPGLTPSGDDLITGFLAGLFSTAADDRALRAFLEGFCLTVARAAASTTDISRAYLTQAADGWFAEPLVTLARQIGAGVDHGSIDSATIAALRVGHTSGGASVFGLLLGLAAWGSRSELLAGSSGTPAQPDLTSHDPPARRPVPADVSDAVRFYLTTGVRSWMARRGIGRMLTLSSSLFSTNRPCDPGKPAPWSTTPPRGLPGSHGPLKAEAMTAYG